jgi:hypothetical protein
MLQKNVMLIRRSVDEDKSSLSYVPSRHGNYQVLVVHVPYSIRVFPHDATACCCCCCYVVVVAAANNYLDSHCCSVPYRYIKSSDSAHVDLVNVIATTLVETSIAIR